MSQHPGGEQRVRWFQEARLGMFVHWGMYAVLGRGEQIQWRDLIPQAEYEPHAADFKPPGDWARNLARQARAAGMKYVVLTTRHHDGYCLFDTATHDFNAAKMASAWGVPLAVPSPSSSMARIRVYKVFAPQPSESGSEQLYMSSRLTWLS